MDMVAALARAAYNAEHLKPLRRAKERFLPGRTGRSVDRPRTGRTLRDALGREEHRAIADEMARFL